MLGRRIALAVALAAVVVACSRKGSQPLASSSQASGADTGAAGAPLSAAAMMRDVRWLCADERQGRGAFQPGAAQTVEYIAEELEAAGLEVVRQPIPRGGENVIGIAPGDDQVVIVSAHYDHLGVDADGVVHPGADDNASGVAVLLGLVRDGAHRRFRHTVLYIAFGAEELGLVGSAEYMAHPVRPIANTVAVINFDMVGRNFFETGANQEATAGIIGLEDHPGARVVALRAAARVGLKLVITPARLLEVFGYDNRTDEWWFRHRGRVAIHFSTGFHDDYHQPTDTVDKLKPDQMVRVANVAAALLAYLAIER